MPEQRWMHQLPTAAATGAAVLIVAAPASASSSDFATFNPTSASGNSALPSSPPIIAPASRDRFEELADRWKRETVNLSSLSALVLHDAYQEIIGMGHPALPLLFRELQHDLQFWFPALRSITGDNPVPNALEGDLEGMRGAWLEWARQHGYL